MRIPAVMIALCLLVGCSATDTPPPPAAPESAAPTQPSPTTSASSPSESLTAFCKDLDVLNVALVAFTADMGRPIVRGGGLADVSEAKRLAGIVADYGKTLQPHAPEDIKDELSTVVAATAEAVGHLGTPDTAALLAASKVMYSEQVTAAREALSAYPACD